MSEENSAARNPTFTTKNQDLVLATMLNFFPINPHLGLKLEGKVSMVIISSTRTPNDGTSVKEQELLSYSGDYSIRRTGDSNYIIRRRVGDNRFVGLRFEAEMWCPEQDYVTAKVNPPNQNKTLELRLYI